MSAATATIHTLPEVGGRNRPLPPTRAAPASPIPGGDYTSATHTSRPQIQASKSRELARAIRSQEQLDAEATASRSYRPPSAWSQTTDAADVVWSGAGAGSINVPPLPSPALSNGSQDDQDRFSDAASWEGDHTTSAAIDTSRERSTAGTSFDPRQSVAPSDFDPTEDSGFGHESRSTYGHARASSVASSMWAGRGNRDNNAASGESTHESGYNGPPRRKAPPPPLPGITPAMALRAQMMNAPEPSPGLNSMLSRYSEEEDDELRSLSGPRPAKAQGHRPQDSMGHSAVSPLSATFSPRLQGASSPALSDFEDPEMTQNPDTTMNSSMFEMMPSNASRGNQSPSSRATTASLGSATQDAPPPRAIAEANKGLQSVVKPSADPSKFGVPPPAPRRRKGRKDRSPVLSYAEGEEEERRLASSHEGDGLGRMNSMGPKLKKNAPAPWEVDGDQDDGDGMGSAGDRELFVPPTRSGFASWARASSESSRPRLTPSNLPPLSIANENRTSVSDAKRGVADLASEQRDLDDQAAAAAARRSRSKSVSSQAAGMLKGLGLATSATPAVKKPGKFAKAFRRNASSPGLGEGKSNKFAAGISSDDYAHLPPPAPAAPVRGNGHLVTAPPSPLSFVSSADSMLPPTPVPPAASLAPLSAPAASVYTSPMSSSQPAAVAPLVPQQGRQSSSAESNGAASNSTSYTSGPSSEHNTAATSPGFSPANTGKSLDLVDLLSASRSTRMKDQQFVPSRSPIVSPRSPLPGSMNRQQDAVPSPPRSANRAGGLGYKRSSTFLAEGAMTRSGSATSRPGFPAANGAGPAYVFPDNRNARSPVPHPDGRSAQSHESAHPASSLPLSDHASTQDLRAGSATPTAAKILPDAERSAQSHGSVSSNHSPLVSPSPVDHMRPLHLGHDVAPPPLRSASSQGENAHADAVANIGPSASPVKQLGQWPQSIPAAVSPGAAMQSLPSVGSHEGVPYKLISLEQARLNQERERGVSARTDLTPALRNKKSGGGFLRRFKDKGGEGDGTEGGAGSMASRPSAGSLDSSGKLNAGASMPSLQVNGAGASTGEDHSPSAEAPALSLRPVSSMFSGLGGMLDMEDNQASNSGMTTANATETSAPVTATASASGALQAPTDAQKLLSPALSYKSFGASLSSRSPSPAGVGLTSSAASSSPASRKGAIPAAIKTSSNSPRDAAPMSGLSKATDVSSPTYQSANSHGDEEETFVSPTTSPRQLKSSLPMHPSRSSGSTGSAPLAPAGLHRPIARHGSVPGALARPYSDASASSDASSALGLVNGFPPTPTSDADAAGMALNPALLASRKRAIEIEQTMNDLAAELSALRAAAGHAAPRASPSDSPNLAATASSPSSIPSCSACGCNCAEQRRLQAANEAAVLKGISIMNRSRALKPSAAGAGKFGGYLDR
ncbi:hypothetical protein IE81DRAFT_345226 [Ceraceosorus guamensis]|uniref:Uncharacterized protein n=1 Tax=Ceraceosorus guamensis TaxID=1522189 RepID=A0A316W9Z6_9BASI|nr:hypothetical protein IE81DRAFT_345226 [Ceraceosorus guamensis]PWN44833.1 hypothetical protein IE81DRAFT_345226 [Ceraceosorus guamensis]